MKLLKSILIGLFRLGYIALGLACVSVWLVTRPDFLSKPIQKAVNERLQAGVRVRDLHYAKLVLAGNAVALKNLKLTLAQQGHEYAVSAENIALFIDPQGSEDCQLVINGGNVAGGALKIADINGRFRIPDRPGRTPVEGIVAAGQARYNDYRIGEAVAHLTADTNAVVFDRMSARAYSGQITGEAHVEMAPDERVTATLDLTGIDTGLVPAVQGRLKGILTARIGYAGTFGSITSLTADFRSPSSDMERTLLKYLMGNINDSLAYLPFAEALEKYDFIHLDKFEGSLHNVGQDKLAIQMNLAASQLNLNLNPSITINLR